MKKYRNTWETLEKKNLEHDVELNLKHTQYDKLYIDHYAARDDTRLEELVEEAIAQQESQQIADGEDPLTEAEKEKITKSARFDQLTK